MNVPLSVEFDNLLTSIQDNEDEPLSMFILFVFLSQIYILENFRFNKLHR
jgi:hypothetical protein